METATLQHHAANLKSSNKFDVTRDKSTRDIDKAIAKNIDIDSKCKNDIAINTHSNELVQVLINIINNAIDATILNNPSNPTIIIDSDYCEEDEYIYLHIRDYGGGVSDDIREKIFEPYFSTKGKNGTGIGLYMSKMIIENRLDGRLDVRNQNGGATFRLKIPID